MIHVILPLLMAAPPSGDGQPQGGMGSLIVIALIFGIFYFFMIRPQNKKQKETQRMLAELKKGDRVVTIGGIHGVIQSVKESSVILKVDDDCKIEFSRNAIASLEASGKGAKEISSGENVAETTEEK
jgi:preprotein translocase subunit YajC